MYYKFSIFCSLFIMYCKSHICRSKKITLFKWIKNCQNCLHSLVRFYEEKHFFLGNQIQVQCLIWCIVIQNKSCKYEYLSTIKYKTYLWLTGSFIENWCKRNCNVNFLTRFSHIKRYPIKSHTRYNFSFGKMKKYP